MRVQSVGDSPGVRVPKGSHHCRKTRGLNRGDPDKNRGKTRALHREPLEHLKRVTSFWGAITSFHIISPQEGQNRGQEHEGRVKGVCPHPVAAHGQAAQLGGERAGEGSSCVKTGPVSHTVPGARVSGYPLTPPASGASGGHEGGGPQPG